MANETIKVDQTVDAKGTLCPLPIVKARRAIDKMESGQVLEVLATDKGAVEDFKGWVKQMNHELLEYHQDPDGVFRFYVKKG